MALRNSILAVPALLLAGIWSSASMAVTPTQNGAAEAKAKAEAATRLRSQTEARKKLDAQNKDQTNAQAKARALAIGKLAVHNETRLRLEAARKAAELHARVMAPQGTTLRGKNQRKPVLRHVHDQNRNKTLAANKSK